MCAGRPRPASVESGHVHHVRTSRDPPSCGRTDWTHGSPAFGRASWPRPLGPTSMSPVGRVDPPHATCAGRPLRTSNSAELSRPAPDTYECRPADRTHDYSTSNVVTSEALQEIDFDGTRHAVSRVGVSGRNRTQLRIRGIMGAVPTINTTLGACEGLDVVVAMVVSPRPERAGQADQDGRPSGAALPAIDLSVVRGVGSSTVVPGSVGS